MKFELKKLLSDFLLKIVYNPKEVDNFEVEIDGIMSGVYEFLGYTKNFKKIVVYGKNDFDIMSRYPQNQIEKGISNLVSMETPFIICSRDFDTSVIKEYAQKYGLLVLSSESTKHEIIGTINPYIMKKNASKERTHGSMISMFGEGVLIIGKSGIGKSELILDLIKQKHLFVGDDAIDLYKFGSWIFGQAAKVTKDFLEVRGIGIINIRRMFGSQVMTNESKLDIVIELVEMKPGEQFERLGGEINKIDLQGIKVPHMKIPVSGGRNLWTVVEAAVIMNKQRKYENYSSYAELTEKINKTKND